jgi:hypothetical protein
LIVLTSCGGGGGADPVSLGRSVVSAIQSENFDDLYGMKPLHRQDADGLYKKRNFEIAEKYDGHRWKDVKERILGDKDKKIDGLDPNEKSGIKDEETWKGASPERLNGLYEGLYKLYAIKKFEDRVQKADFYLSDWGIYKGRRGEKEIENRMAEVEFVNNWGDRIEITAMEDNGVWYLVALDVKFNEEPRKAKDD